MKTGWKCFGILSGFLAFGFCLAGGLWLLANMGLDSSDPLGGGLGLYFVGKALFVGPMLILTTMQFRKEG